LQRLPVLDEQIVNSALIMAILQTRIKYLLQQYATNNCTRIELLELFEWLEQQNDDMALQNAMLAVWKNRNAADVAPVIDKEKVYARIIMQASPERKISTRGRGWVRLAAAAVFLLAIAGTVYLISNRTNRKPIIAGLPYKGDVAPGHNGAVLTLSNGQKIVLDNAGNGELVKDGNVVIIKKGGEITYRGKTDEIVYNTISTSKGRQWQLSLSDGTKVWLNPASSIRYPLSFVGNERKVEITGEAYFEVVHNSKQPFRVHINTPSGDGATIEDIGTTFNVNAYSDEPVVKTTLLEGSVRVSTGFHSSLVLRPGQQAVVSTNQSANTRILENIDTEEITAWKDGLFKFNEGSVETIMRQIGRWYNVDIVYEGAVPDKQIHGSAPRNTNLSSIIKVLSLSGIHVQMEENKIIVKP
jgi:transmembrane sensor